MEARRDADLHKERFWLVESSSAKNRTGKVIEACFEYILCVCEYVLWGFGGAGVYMCAGMGVLAGGVEHGQEPDGQGKCFIDICAMYLCMWGCCACGVFLGVGCWWVGVIDASTD